MADYLLPDSPLSVDEKKEMFNIRCEMNEIPSNFGRYTYCEMGCNNAILDNKHLLKCESLNHKGRNEPNTELDLILNGTLSQKIIILRKIQENNEKRKLILSDSDKSVNPLSRV